ncbi:hypothetical protein ACWATR_25120 [Nostoc sp. UIC 10890]
MSNTIDNLKVYHRTLMSKYVDIIQKNTTLSNKSCSVLKDYLHITFNDIENSLTKKLSIPILGRVFALIIKAIVFLFLCAYCIELWIITIVIAKTPLINRFGRFLTLQNISLHIKAKSNELENVYKLILINKQDNPDSGKNRLWLEQAIQDCNHLSSVINLNKIVFISKVIWSCFSIFGLLKILSDFFKSNNDLFLTTFIVCILLIAISPLILFPFIYKRVFFVKNEIYELENKLFKAIEINRGIPLENKDFSWDFLIYIINFMARFLLVSVLFSSLRITKSIFEAGDILLLSVAAISFTTLFITRQLR